MTRFLRNFGNHFFRFGIALTIGTITTSVGLATAKNSRHIPATKVPVKSSAKESGDSKAVDTDKQVTASNSNWIIQEKTFRFEPAFSWLDRRDDASDKPDPALITFMQEQKLPVSVRAPRVITVKYQSANDISVAHINPFLLRFDPFKQSSRLSEYPENYASGGPGISLEYLNRVPIADGFDFPVGKPHGRGYYNAQKFTRNQHLGDDWNGRGGGNTDLNDPIYSIGNGIVISARKEPMNWGNVVRIVHNMGTKTNPVFVESMYAHMRKMLVRKGDRVRRGQKIGTIGNVGGVYYAHLHLEIRNVINKSIGTGYSHNTDGYLDPTRFIRRNRPGLKYAKRYLPKTER